MQLEQVELLAGVVRKTLDLRNGDAAERLLASIVGECACSREDVEVVAQMHAILVPLLSRVEALTGRPFPRLAQA